MKTLFFSLIIAISVLFCLISQTHAEVPQLIRYQGYITDKNDPPQGLNGDYKIAFSLYNTEFDGTPLWQETYDGENKISISNGQFSVLLGNITPLDNIGWEDELWLQIEVEDEIMDARQRIVSVPFALKAKEANTLTGSSLYIDAETGNVGIGTTSPEATLEVAGDQDANTKLLMHFNDNFADETGKTVTVNGTAQIATGQYKFGGASAYFDGDGDYLSLADSDDWNFGSGDFTIDFWVNFVDVASVAQGIWQQRTDNNHWMALAYINGYLGGFLSFAIYNDGMAASLDTAYLYLSDSTWYHVALVKTQGTYKIYLDGIEKAALTTGVNLEDYTGTFMIGKNTNQGASSYYVKGWIDEFRVSKGIARWTSDFSNNLPSKEYVYGGGDAIFVGDVKANSFIGNMSTGDITFNKDAETLWRMFEEEDGLYLESAKTDRIYKIMMEEITENDDVIKN